MTRCARGFAARYAGSVAFLEGVRVVNEALHELVEHLARALVKDPAAVEVRNVGTEEALVLELRVAPDDLGKVIGKQGSTARALRTVLATAAGRVDRRALLNIVEES